jgi:hypothetical protein
MADLASILKDPNYINANAATKAAIFDKWAPQDPNFANANAETQQAIRVRFGVAAPAPAAPASAPPVPAPAGPTEPTTYAKVRDFVAPTLEALGAVGGGAVGSLGGPFGTVAGAGLGYATAKELTQAADKYAGYAPKESLGEATARVAQNALEGAAMETGGRVLGQGLGYIGGKIADLRQIPKQKAAEIARNALGPDLDAVKNALSRAPADVTAAQATADINSPTWQALLDRASKRDPRFLNALKESQGEVSVNALAKLAGGATATEARGVAETAKKNLNTITTPMRESAIARANLGAQVANEADQRMAHDIATRIGTGSSIEPAEFVAQATGAEKTLRSFGIKPLEGAPLADKIQSIPKNPAFAENDLVEGAANKVADAIRKWTGSNGVIDANALEAIRKNAVDAAIAGLRPGADATTQRNLAAKVMSNIKPLIDDAIESAGGSGWREYLAAHAKGMQAINEKKLVSEALALFKKNPDEFVKLVQGESPDAVEKILGPSKYDIAKEVSDNMMSTLKDQASKVVRDMKVKEQSAAGQDALKELLLQQISKMRIPSYLSAVASTTNKALQILENKIGTKTMDVLTKASQTPEGAAELLNTLPGAERNRVLKLLSNPQDWKPGAAATAVNALKPEEDRPKNMLRIELTGKD